MARLSVPVAQSASVAQPVLIASDRRTERWFSASWVLAAFVVLGNQTLVSAGPDGSRVGMGVSSMSEAQSGSLLVEYFKEFVADRDVDQFKSRVAARYNEGTLGRILAGSADVAARRAAVLSLGIMGTFEQSNAALGRALCDQDLAVRSMAEDALWAVWFRADTPAHNRALAEVQAAITRKQLEKAEVLATRLIAEAPDFAEAYNQRAIVYALQGRYAESVEDCQRVLDRNPFHIGAISGMAQCQLLLNRERDALKSLRRALKLRPHDTALRASIDELERKID